MYFVWTNKLYVLRPEPISTNILDDLVLFNYSNICLAKSKIF